MVEMTEAVRRKDFAAFAELTMKDSNQFHATCLDTFPPIFYLSSVSQQVIGLVHRYNRFYGETRVRNLINRDNVSVLAFLGSVILLSVFTLEEMIVVSAFLYNNDATLKI